MSLADEYRRQFGWRAWPEILGALPLLPGQTVLDLGCGMGDQAAELVGRGARVIGFDMNEELLAEARSRGLSRAEFRRGDLRGPLKVETAVDGLWCSFAAAYIPDLAAALASWGEHLRPGGWIALTEIDDLFAHEPLASRTRSVLDAYTREAFKAGRYDFHMGRKLRGHLERAEFTISSERIVEDREFSFAGPASPEVAEAWRVRFDRLKLLRDLSGERFEQVRQDFLDCLADAGHRSGARVYCHIATK